MVTSHAVGFPLRRGNIVKRYFVFSCDQTENLFKIVVVVEEGIRRRRFLGCSCAQIVQL